MDVSKRLRSIHGAVEPKGAGVTFTLESEGGDSQTFTASAEVFQSVLRFMFDLDSKARQDSPAARQTERITDPLQTTEGLEIFLDMRAGRALLQVHTARGRTVQLELSEEMLARLEVQVPKVLAELRKQERRRPH